jgi:hypothetical protein
MEFLVSASNRKYRKLITFMLPSLIAQLGLKNSKSVLYVTVEGERDGDDMGSTVDMGPMGSYVIVIKPMPLARMALTLAHEMVHVSQMARGMLKTTKSGARIWCGKKFPKNTKYLNQPWELHAFARQEIIMRRALEE